MNQSPTTRFSDRVENYVKYRPTYPDAVLDLLKRECDLNESSVVADIGSGTGISTALLLKSKATVYAIEPNADMRVAAEHLLAGNSGFISIAAQAEATTLPGLSLDLIVAGQAFHWFEPEPTNSEFLRILKPDGWLVLMWNERQSIGSPFIEGYEKLLRDYSPEYLVLNHKEVGRKELATFFRGGEVQLARFPNSQSFDFEGLTGRLLSSSYAPLDGDPSHEPMMAAFRALYDAYQVDGTINFLYETQVFYGHL